MQMKQPEAPQMPAPELAKLTPQDLEDREDFKYLLSIMEKQRAVGITQPVDYKDAISYRDNIETFLKGTSPEGSVATLFDNVIFDFDGVLHDTTYSVYRAVELALEEKGIKNIPTPETIEKIAESYQAPYKDYYKRFGILLKTPKEIADFWNVHYYKILCNLINTPEEIKSFQKAFRKIQAQVNSEHHTPAALYPETKAVLDKLREMKKDNPKLKLHVVSAGSKEQVRDLLLAEGIADEFDEIHLESDGKTKMIQSIADKGEKGRTVMIGDLPSDIKDAQLVDGVKTIAVARGEIEQERLGMYLPDYIVPDLNSLFDLKSLSRKLREKK